MIIDDDTLARLASWFGTAQFTTAQAGAYLGLRSDQDRELGNRLRYQLDHTFDRGGTSVALHDAGTVAGGRRRWRFEVVPGEFDDAADPDADLI